MGKTSGRNIMGQIVVPYGVQDELAKLFKVSTRTVYSALHYDTRSGLAKTIRAAARQRGGYEIPAER